RVMKRFFIYDHSQGKRRRLYKILLTIKIFFLLIICTSLQVEAHAGRIAGPTAIRNVYKIGVSEGDIKRGSDALFSHNIQGTVVDSATGEPLVGVTIKVKGSTMGTTSGGGGKFSLEV